MTGLTQNPPFVSVVIPVKNAQRFIPQCLNSLNKLNYPKDRYEIIIVDSSSTDKTRELASSLGARVVIADGESVCSGRNSGFKAAKGEIIAFSDADCVMDRDWLFNAVKYFKDETIGCVGGPSLTPEDETDFGKACGFIFSHRIFTGGSTYGLNLKEVKIVKHNPGCNAIYQRAALEKVMPVDECFIEGEDVIMNKRIADLGYKFLYTPDTRLWHYRSSTIKRFWRQNFRYAIGRLLMGRAYRELLKPMHILVGLSVPLAVISISAAAFINPPVLPGLFTLVISFLAFFAFYGLARTHSLRAALYVPLAILILMTAWSMGFMKELLLPVRKTTGKK